MAENTSQSAAAQMPFGYRFDDWSVCVTVDLSGGDTARQIANRRELLHNRDGFYLLLYPAGDPA
jgi:hypothetical protein